MIDGLECLCVKPEPKEATSSGTGGVDKPGADAAPIDRIAYIIYPMDMLADWVGAAAEKYNTAIVVVTGMEWQDAMSPWPAKGVPRGCPDFKGLASHFLSTLQQKVIPQAEAALDFSASPRRTLVGVSMSGLFALWQWMLCDTFADIASLSGSFWYEGFLDWFKNRPIPRKQGKAFFLLGDKEAYSRVKAFDTVAANTHTIVELLRAAGIDTQFRSVPGNHYDFPIPRLNLAFSSLFGADS